MGVCLSVRPSICPSVTATMWNNFWPQGQIVEKFSGSTYLLASNFWAVNLDPQALRVRPGPPKVGFQPDLSPPRFLGQGGFVIPYWKREDKAKKLFGVEFWFSAHGLRKWGQKGGLDIGAAKILEFQHFSIQMDPSKMRSWLLFVLCTFFIWRTPLVPLVPPGPGGWKSKVKIMDILIEGTLTKIKF